jgi:DNA-binding response OmpR family regulator
LRILIVDDDEDLQLLLTLAFARSGDQADAVATAAEALHKLETDNFDVCILDVRLPDRSGFDVCQVIKTSARTANLPVLMLSADIAGATDETAKQYACDDFLAKPFTVSDLIARVQALATPR